MKQYIFLGASTLLFSTVQAQEFFSRNNAAKRDYESVRLQLRSYAAANPKNAEVVVITDSDSGRPVEGLKIGNGPTSHLIVSAHHGNEYGSTEVALAAAKDLAEHPVENRTVYVVPVLNIGGYDKKNRYEKVGNFRQYDPNRDYPGPCATEGPFKLKSTKGIAKFVEDKKIVSAATLHTYWPAVLYPWGNSADNFATFYDNLFIKLAQSATFRSNYEIGYSGEVIYPADGTFEDYVYWKHGVWSLLFEMGGSHFPNQTDIDKMISVNVPGLRKMMEDSAVTTAEDHRFVAKCEMRKGVDPRLD